MSFQRKKLHDLLGAGLTSSFVTLLLTSVEFVIAGNFIGTDGIAGIGVVLPVFSVGLFVARLLYSGTVCLFSRYQGEFDVKRAGEIVGLSLELCAGAFVLILATMAFLREPYLNSVGVTGGIREQATMYWNWAAINLSFMPFVGLATRLVPADGGAKVSNVSNIAKSVVSIAVMVVVVGMTRSAAGCAIGGFSANVVGTGILCLHLFSKRNGIHPKWHFSLSDAWALISYALTDSSARLCKGGVVAAANAIVMAYFGERFLAVVPIAILVCEFTIMCDRVGDDYTPLAGMYLGEGNNRGLRALLSYSAWLSLALGAAVGALVGAFSTLLPLAHGVRDAEIARHCTWALCLASLSLPVNSLLAFINSHFLILGHVTLSVVMTWLEKFILTALGMWLFAYMGGIDVMWLGFLFGGVLTLAVLFVYMWAAHRPVFPFFLPPEADDTLNVSFVPEVRRIIDVRKAVEEFLSGHGTPRKEILRIMLLVEECAMALIENNRGCKGKVVAEGSFRSVDGETRVVFRDTGNNYDITDRDVRVKGLRDFVIAEMMHTYKDRRYMSAVGCNRAAFVFRHADFA